MHILNSRNWIYNTSYILKDIINFFQEFGIFWPVANEEMEAESFRVKFVDEGDQSGYVTRDFTVHSLQDDYELPVRMIHCANWPHNCSPITSVFELINLVQEWHLEYQNGPIVVMDRYSWIILLWYKFTNLFTCSSDMLYWTHDENSTN
jgi:receptor-type tyrosine-protein phosphatase gamma